MSVRWTGVLTVVAVVTAVFAALSGCDSAGTYVQGKRIYEAQCLNCHQADGQGLVGHIPPLANADWLREHRAELACAVHFGLEGPIEVNGLPYQGRMAGHSRLTPTEVANVLNYVLHAWGNDLPQLPPGDVKAMIDACHRDGWVRVRASDPQQASDSQQTSDSQ